MNLAKYLAENGIKPAAFSREINVSRAAVSRYVSGRVPKGEILQRIRTVTKGKVTPNDFLPQAEAAE